jgi:hypothetical protein
MTNPITRHHRLSVARAWEDDGVESAFALRWVNGEWPGPLTPTLAKLERLAQLVADAEGAWIPCPERMPEPGAPVLFWVSDWLPDATPGLGPFIDDYVRGQHWQDETQTEGYDGDPKRHYTKSVNAEGVTHWRPLPSKPPEQS